MEVFAVPGLPEFEPGDDLAAAIEAQIDLRPDDVVCVASTVVSKVEDRRQSLARFEPTERARSIAQRLASITGSETDPRFVQAVLEESTSLVLDAPFLLAVTRFGHVGVNAGIDRSNTGGPGVLLLPEAPSESAARIRAGLAESPGVIVTDTSGRPFRTGQRGVAIGWDGVPVGRDWRGEQDRDGTELAVTVENVADELAAAANLVSGEGAGGTPVVVVRDFEFGEHGTTEKLFRDRETDYVRQALEAWEYGKSGPAKERVRERPEPEDTADAGDHGEHERGGE
ncbi:coenzyme F420-0:L-glutamate ligase [Halodesulfurarchaeum sp. HSR-GB]|uniref:coenzyme F420-0:L-glutamate ligase n=1 Tax=Halodesulfurarchaeum sp. HSR-GB TaxID=3074077 RepID=UPI002857F642|nr:coenzyme F420-0:L-glutamate ligase [Halodesulfurarchaeum sp. HSR-GB]MDR5656608.1 coenzyme F420-0:L-glutamate ligase [Halodesulfurarchaeum sp. HSR-GB]